MRNAVRIAACVVALCSASLAAAQTAKDQPKPPTAKEVEEKVAQAKAVQTKIEEMNPRFVNTLTNVQIDVNLTDQVGNQAPEKKTVSMIVSNRNWGKIRSAANMMTPGEQPYSVMLNVDARPFVSVDGLIQLELTMVYEPVKNLAEPKDKRPTGVNQSQTVILQSGKPLIVAQAADPVSDRKVIVEVKATILK